MIPIRWHRSWAAAALVALLSLAATVRSEKPDIPSLAQSAKVSVDSSFPGYNPAVLTDGRWYAKGEENPNDFGPTRLGNGGNAWVSGDTPGEHWICLDWPQAVALNEVEIWWALADWYPRAFRIERWEDGRWLPAGVGEGWFAPLDRQVIIALPKTRTQRLRILQSEAGAKARRLMSAQEVRVFNREGNPRATAGVRALSPEALARLTAGPELVRNLARLNEVCAGAVSVMGWDAKGRGKVIGASGVFGDRRDACPTLAPGRALGAQWPVRHSIDGVAVVFAQEPPALSGLVLEVDNGRDWVAVTTGLKSRVLAAERRVEWTFEPVVTRAVRVGLAKGEAKAPVEEIEVLRFMPPSKDVWPARLTQKEGLKQEMLAARDEPSFEALALNAHNMQPARAFVGLKDHPSETGVGWEGSLIGRETIQFRFGAEEYALADYPDTTTRTLIDGWRPGVLVEGRMNNLQVRETVLAVPMGSAAQPVVFIRFSVRNLSNQPRSDWIEATIAGERPGKVQLTNGTLTRGPDPILVSQWPAVPGELPASLRVTFTLRAGEERHMDFVHPQFNNAPSRVTAECRSVSFAQALAEFRGYWDRVMATPTVVELPEERVNRLVKAVLAQCFVCGDGNIMPYGAAPSVYEGSLFGIEESYPMLGLALFGYGKEAQRYMDGTYLTRDFLKKAAQYDVKQPEPRHQQYRNGLEPHYAVSLYRLTRDEAWLRRHLPLLNECAEWTMVQRRRTMELENGQKPLHWGLLPKWAYGGDILDVLCYPIFPNLCCWRGLVDTAWAVEQVGDTVTADRYRADAREYRAAIDRAIEGSYRADHQPPFLALKLYGTQPDEQLDYYQLFAGCLLDVEAFAPGSRHARWIADYLEESNRMFCHLPRFRHLGPGALDAIYGKGYWLNLLHEDAIRDYLLALYAYLAFNLEHETFVSRESNVLYPSDLHQRSSFPTADISDPLVCGSAVALHLVRHMLVTEERGAAGEYSGNLLLLAGVPRAWLQDGKQIRLRQMPTHFGPMSLEVVSHAARKRVEARFTPPARDPCQTVKLRFRHPDDRPIQSVRVNGKPWSDFDSAKEWVRLPGNIGPCRVEARY